MKNITVFGLMENFLTMLTGSTELVKFISVSVAPILAEYIVSDRADIVAAHSPVNQDWE